MNRCTNCLIPDTRPDTAFIDGVCSACVNYGARRNIDWQQRELDFIQILDRQPNNGSGFDCIVPSSGGKDSTAQVFRMISLGARPLVVTASTCHLTDIGRANIDNLARFATTVEITPNRTVRAQLNRMTLALVGDPSWPEHASIFRTPFKAAIDFGIPLIVYGESPQREYGGPVGSEVANQMTLRWVSEFGGFLGLRASDLAEGVGANAMLNYAAPSANALRQAGVEAHFLGQYFAWDSHENARVARENGMACELPCLANWWNFENLDNAQTGLHDHFMFRKFCYGRLCAQLSVDIRSGRITRDKALGICEERDGHFPHDYMGVPVSDVCARIGLHRHELEAALEAFTNWQLFPDGLPQRAKLT